jgi:signal transduction histidine kinase
VKELMMNAVKHSKAKTVDVSMRIDDHRVTLAVRDDGVGFSVGLSGNGKKRSGGFGLFSIRERLDTIGGSFVVNSSAGGAEIVLSAPTEGGEGVEHSHSHS